VPTLLERAARHGLRVCFHIEPYPQRSALSVKSDVASILAEYGRHEAFYRTDAGKPLFFMFVGCVLL
jgi:hypothetical protein